MQAISEAISRLHEEVAWFTRAHEIRLLVIRTSGDLRKTVLKLLPKYEYHADNFSPWVLLEDAFTDNDDGWQTRANRLVGDWEMRREAFAEENIALPKVDVATISIPESQAASHSYYSTDRSRSLLQLNIFYRTALAVLDAIREPLKGLVLLISPTIIDNHTALETDLETLLSDQSLKPCRFILVTDIESPIPEKLLERLGSEGLFCDCIADEAQQDRDLEALISGSGGETASGTVGAYPKGIVPPRRVDDPPELSKKERDAALRDAGINPRYLDEAPRLRSLVLGAAFAMKKGKGGEALTMQSEACDLCENLGMHEMKVICQVALASYLSGLGKRDQAIMELRKATQYAENHGLPKSQSQAHLALGLVYGVGGQTREAAQEDMFSAKAAEAAKIEILAIEGWRLAGQYTLQAGEGDRAEACFREALRVAGQSDANVVKNSSAADVARLLATQLKKKGLNAQADSLFDCADQLERGVFSRGDAISNNPGKQGG